MTDERMLKIQGISNDVVTAMHSLVLTFNIIFIKFRSLSSIPENAVTEAPRGLRVDLLPHQKTGLTWLLWREQQMPPRYQWFFLFKSIFPVEFLLTTWDWEKLFL